MKNIIFILMNLLRNNRLERWYFNRKNKVKVLSEKEWRKIVQTGKIKKNIVVLEV